MVRGVWWEPDLSDADSERLTAQVTGLKGPKVRLPDPRDEKLKKPPRKKWDRVLRSDRLYDLGVRVRPEVIVALEELANEAGVSADQYVEWLIMRGLGEGARKAYVDRLGIMLEAELEDQAQKQAYWNSLE